MTDKAEIIKEPLFIGEQTDTIDEEHVLLSEQTDTIDEEHVLLSEQKALLSQIVKRKSNKRKARKHSSYISRETRQGIGESRTSNVKRQVKEVKKKRTPIKRRSRGRGSGCSTCPGSGVSRFSKKGN